MTTDDPSRPRTPYGDPAVAGQRARDQLRENLPPWLSHEPPSKVRQIRHCWLLVDGERLPGLLLSRRQAGSSWEGRVIRPEFDVVDEKWRPRDDWVGAEQIEQKE